MNFSSFLCKDPLDYLCMIPEPFMPLQKPPENSGFPEFRSSGDKKLSASSKQKRGDRVKSPDQGVAPWSPSGEREKNFIDEQLGNELTAAYRRVEKVNESDLKSALSVLDPYNSMPYTADELAMRSISYLYDIIPNVDELLCLTLGDAPGTWISYLQKKYANTYCYAMSRKEIDWNYDNLDLRACQFLYGANKNGYIEEEKEWTVNFLQTRVRDLDLVICNNTIGIAQEVHVALSVLKKYEKKAYDDPHPQPLSLEEIGMGITSRLRDMVTESLGGNLVLRLEDSSSFDIGQLIYILASAFEETVIYKPVVVGTHKYTRYLICKNYLGCDLNMLNKILEIPDDFRAQLTHVNNMLARYQLDMCTEIIKYPEIAYAKPRDLSRLILVLGVKGTMPVEVF